MTNDLIGKRVNVLDKGWVELVDMLPHPNTGVSGDLAIVNAARVSFMGESKGPEKDKKLLFYLLRNAHTSPFEMVEFKFRCRAPLVTWWQWARHRVWNFNAQCLAGDVEVIFDRPDNRAEGSFGVGSKITMKRLYERWHNEDRARIREMHLRTVNEETMLLESARVGDVVYAGKKAAFKVTTGNGRKITCSADHRFLFENGWSTLAEGAGLELVNNRAVWEGKLRLYVNGKPLDTAHLYTSAEWLYYQYHTRNLPIKDIATLAVCSTHTIRKFLRKHGLTLPSRSRSARFQNGIVPWNKGKHYSFQETLDENLRRRERARKSVRRGSDCHFWKGGISSERAQIARWTRDNADIVFKRDNYLCQYCGQQMRSDDIFHAHHIIPVWADESKAYDINNLITLHESCHHHIHGQNLELAFAQQVTNGTANFDVTIKIDKKQASLKTHSHATPMLVDITDIEYVGEMEMYDLVVDGPYPNFVANWFVVHNSGRYTPFEENDFYVPDVWRKQAADNKQASEGEVDAGVNAELTEKLLEHYKQGFALYEDALKAGVSKEMARLFLPGFSVYYTWVAKVDAHNLMHFLRLRMASDAQHEIRVYAKAIYEEFFKPALPWTAEAFEEYVLKKQA